jgi:hypothetical protein
MIRDPSDGSTREQKNPRTDLAKCADLIIDAETSGLPTASTKPKDLARLEKSREWLKQYFKRNPEQGT